MECSQEETVSAIAGLAASLAQLLFHMAGLVGYLVTFSYHLTAVIFPTAGYLLWGAVQQIRDRLHPSDQYQIPLYYKNKPNQFPMFKGTPYWQGRQTSQAYPVIEYPE